MTWGALLRALLTDPLAWLFAFVVGVLCGLAGYFYGQHTEAKANELAKQTATVVAYEEVKPKEAEAAKTINEVAKVVEHEKKSTNIAAAAIVGEFSGLRVKPACQSVPTIAAAGSQLAGSTGSERPRTGEVDFDGITRKVAELGRDYDNAARQIKALTIAAEAYRKACNVE
jgi:hypothetical protein